MQKNVKLLVSACVLAMAMILFGCSQQSGSTSASESASGASAAASAASAESTDAQADSAAAASQSASATDASASASTSAASTLANGVYSVDVDTGSSMFHVNEANEGKGTLTVTDEGMTLHISLASKKITKLYAGTTAQMNEDPDGIIEPTTDKVTYSDGAEEEVYGFDIPVPALDQAFDVAILGSKGNWYDHKVTVSNPISE